ncbi:hypothetical protein M514_03833 [Trichuris suis]|uniref:Uncharacterized protein n=1 Tax=Trichuris suis TaxID=68888 RepID=A0A085N7J8_9BILA|nr:hypothetical protein M513_03833 [Trichuris suis]KFD65444.1 hypothetical protein M514_03833 [Trichuris suis]KHJ45256.1 hypothetical protein D918_04560 [Trichuris suis]
MHSSLHWTICVASLLVCIHGRPTKNLTESNVSPLLNWGRFLFSEDGIVQSLTNMAKDHQPAKASPTRQRFWDLKAILRGMGVDLRSQDDGLFDIFQLFDPSKMGLCNRKTCGDIYKFFDKIRTSEFLLNLRTLFSLLRDQEGLDLLRMLLTNPNMIRGILGNRGGVDDNSDGTDYVTGLEKPDKPEIAFVIDKTKRPGGGDYDDYYFDGIPNNPNDQIMTINKPIHDVNIKTIKGVINDEVDDMGSGTTTAIELTTRPQVDYYAYYYDGEKQNGSGSMPDVVS